MDVSDRFWSKVDIQGPDDCWLWQGNSHVKGYGIFWFEGKNVRANRHALSITKGPAPFEGALSLHSCDNPPCCNPAHLRWGTQQDNVDDRNMRKGPLVGENSPVATIDNQTVSGIYKSRLDGLTIAEIASNLSLPETTVENVYTGRSWSHRLGVDGNPTLSELRASKPKRKHVAHNRILTDEMADRIFRGRMEGKSLDEISKEMGLPTGTVSHVYSGLSFTDRLGKYGNPTFEELRSVTSPNPQQKLTEDDIQEIRHLLSEGYIGVDIARKYGVSRATISNIKTGKR